MTEHPYQKSRLPQLYPQHKRPLSSTSIALNLNNHRHRHHHHRHHHPLHHQNHQQNYVGSNRNDHQSINPNYTCSYDDNNQFICTSPNNDGCCEDEENFLLLTEEHLKTNVQIVLNNINRNYNALKEYILYDKSSPQTKGNNFYIMSSPESDCNSNPHIGHPLGCSIASSQDFTHDNSDYQWFLDYGYREGITHQSILSSLSASYNGIGELSYYEDLAKNIDANLAEVDMESFCAEDIHSLLNRIPSRNRNRQDNEFDTSICKSELLFSPVKESHISVDSLDMDGYPNEEDIILTCKANKDNYTIAFEGSIGYSEDSYYDNAGESKGNMKQNSINMTTLDDIVKRKSLEVSMSRSDTGLTTWSKLKKSSTSQLQRYPSGNNNTSVTVMTRHSPHCLVRKSSSMPNLRLSQQMITQLNVSQVISNSTVDSYGKIRTLLPMCPMPISSTSESESPVPAQSNTSNEQVPNQPSFNLVKLFIKQKSSSTDTCMDVSSGCWPSDSTSSVEQNRVRKKSMNDSGKCSALSRHDEEEDNESSFQFDSLDVEVNQDNKNNQNQNQNQTNKNGRSNDLYREVFDSPAHRNYKECNLNIKNYPKNPIVYNLNNNNNNSMERDSLKETNKSSSDTSRTSENLTQISNKTKIPLDMITRSMQTSVGSKERVKVVPPSFLAQLNNLGDKKTAPVYVIYPNYALPNLDFLKQQNEVILSPLGYKEAFSPNAANKSSRPNSLADVDSLKKSELSHVVDWKSLATLLPQEYKKLLTHIPEVEHDERENDSDLTSQKPLFCMTPPLRRSRSMSCDCVNYVQTNCTSSSSGSSTNQPPSSGYRGSSTILTDSELDNNNDNMRNLYVYQYENNRMENDVVTETTPVDRPPSGRTPPRGILRRTSSKNKNKRNSMFENQHHPNPIDKRRSLQDMPYYISDQHNIIEDYLAEMEDMDVTQKMLARLHNAQPYSGYNNVEPTQHNRLPNHRQYYPSDDYNTKLNKTNLNYMTELNDLELNKAVTSRLTRTPPSYNLSHLDNKLNAKHDIEARIRAENFLSSIPKSELKYYAEVANILESIDNIAEPYDRVKLRNEVSRALSQKKVSFTNQNENVIINNINNNNNNDRNPNLLETGRAFTTPPNSPNISMAAPKLAKPKSISVSEKEKQEKIQSNRFKRLQIQWELLSKDSQALNRDLHQETKSGGSTPTSGPSSALKSRIPRPVSYPASKQPQENKVLRSPSRIVPPKKYSSPIVNTATLQQQQQQPVTPRTPSKLHNTPKKTTPRPVTRTR